MPDATWIPFAFPNPPDAEYPLGHAIAGGAAAAVLKSFFATDAIPFSITNNAGVTRAETENSVSRIFTGCHLRTSTARGQAMGEQIGAYVAANTLK